MSSPFVCTTPEEKYDGIAEGAWLDEDEDVDADAVWSMTDVEDGRREWTAGARMKMALKGSEGVESSGMTRGASKDSSWAKKVNGLRIVKGVVGILHRTFPFAPHFDPCPAIK